MTADALALRVAGESLPEIADRLGYPDPAAAARAVRDEIGRTDYAHMPEAHALHLLRLDTIADALAARDPEDEPERAARLLVRVHRQRRAVLSALADALQRADSGGQIGGRE